ncbi:hypothetical protein RUND412_010276 [Rhizina undulata]
MSTAVPAITATKVDFAKSPLKCYAGNFALVIDNAFTAEECAEFIKLAESDPAGWQAAKLNAGGGKEILDINRRDCGRIIRDDFDTAGKIFERIRPYLKDIEATTTGGGNSTRKWRLVRMNERLRFLKYKPGQYFKPHWDGTYETPDGLQRSFMTIHLYLNSNKSVDPSSELKGGATRFMKLDPEAMARMNGGKNRYKKSAQAFMSSWFNKGGDYLDVDAVQGRVLVFQHLGLLHSGEEVHRGVKMTMRSDLMYERFVEEEEDQGAEDV